MELNLIQQDTHNVEKAWGLLARVGTILGIEFEKKSNWLVMRSEEMEAVRGGDLDNKIKEAEYIKQIFAAKGLGISSDPRLQD